MCVAQHETRACQALLALAQGAERRRRWLFPAGRGESTLSSHWEIYPSLPRCGNQPGPEMDPSQDNPINWRTLMKSLPGKNLWWIQNNLWVSSLQRGAFKRFKYGETFCFLPEIYHFSVFFFFKKRAAQQTDPLWHHKGHRSLSEAFFLSLVQRKAECVVFFGGRETFWIIDLAMAACSSLQQLAEKHRSENGRSTRDL